MKKLSILLTLSASPAMAATGPFFSLQNTNFVVLVAFIAFLGILVYMNVDGRMQDAVQQVAAHGGKVVEPAHSIGPHGFRALIIDSEGNRLALHSNTDA